MIEEKIDKDGKWLIDDGVKSLIEPSEEWFRKNQPPLTIEQILEPIRKRRNDLLNDADKIIDRHRSQRELLTLGKITNTTITEEKYIEWLEYKQLLRDFPETIHFLSISNPEMDFSNPTFPEPPK